MITPAAAQGVVNSSLGTDLISAKVPKNKVVATVSVGTGPEAIVVSPDSSLVYVAAENTVSVIDAGTMTVTANIPVSGDPFSIAISPNGETLFVPDYSGNTVAVVDTATKTVTTRITVGTAPDCVAVSPDGQWVYVAAYVGGTVSVINAKTNQLSGEPIVIGGDLDALVFAPDGKLVYASAAEGPGYFGWINTDLQTYTRIPDGKFSPFFLCILPNGKRLYGATQDFKRGTEKIVAIAASDKKVVHEVVLPKEVNELNAMGLTADGKFLYVAALTTLSLNGEVFMVDTARNKIVGQPLQISSGPEPSAIVVSPDDKFAYVANVFDDTVTVIGISNE